MKDAKGHGSNKRGGDSIDMVFSSKAGVGGLGKGMYARTASGDQYKLNPAATNGMVPRVGSTLDPSQHTAVGIAAQHGISTAHLAPAPTQRVSTNAGPFKVQSLDTNRAGQPWATQRSFRNNTVAERVALRMAADGGHMRVKVR